MNIQIPFTSTSIADVEELMQRTEVLRVEDTSEIPLNDIEEL